MDDLNRKLETVKSFIAEKGKDGVVIAFSGGVDSSTLAAVSRQVLGEKAVAVIAQSPTYTSEELLDAKKVASEIGIKLYTINTDELSNPDFSKNPENRCYYCKKELLLNLVDFAHTFGFKAVFEGTSLNATLRAISSTFVDVEISVMRICFLLAFAAKKASLVLTGNLSRVNCLEVLIFFISFSQLTFLCFFITIFFSQFFF